MTIVASNSLTLSNVNDGTITHTAYAYSADGTNGFTTVYPNLNLLDGTRDFSGVWTNGWRWTEDGTYNGLTVRSYQKSWDGMFKRYIIPEDDLYTWSSFVKSESDTSNIFRVFFLNNKEIPIVGLGHKFDWLHDSVTVSLKKGDEVIFNYGNLENNGGKISIAGYKLEHGSNATPWMPSSSEVTTADWPKYIGQYTDFTSADSTNPSAYTWSLIRGNDGKDAPTITVKSYTYSAGSRAEIELTGPNAFKQTVYNRGHNVWVIDTTTHSLKEFVSCDTYTAMSFSYNGVSMTLADYLASLKDSIVVIAASDADAVDQNVRNVLNCMGGFPDLGTWNSGRIGHVFIGMSKRNDGTWPLQPRQGYEEVNNEDGSTPEIGCTLSKGGIVANGATGPKGADGANGKDGIAGKDGVGIKTTDITYAISTSGTTAPTTGWTSSVPSLVKGQYLWTKTVWTYTDNSSETGYSVTYISKDGNNGSDGIAGKDGTGIKTTTITYVGSTSGTTAPTSGWTSTVPTVAAGSYLWTKTVWTYTDNSSETGYSVAKMGEKGDTGDRGLQGLQGPQGNQGIQGPKGVDGKSSYTHIAYGTSSTGAGFTQTPSASTTYIGMYVDNVATDSNDPTKYAWSLVKGEDGSDGIPGKPGADGKTPYFHIAYADSADGKNGFYVGGGTNLAHGTSSDWTKVSVQSGDWGVRTLCDPTYEIVEGGTYTVQVEVRNVMPPVMLETYCFNSDGTRLGLFSETRPVIGNDGIVSITFTAHLPDGYAYFQPNLAFNLPTTGAGSYEYRQCKIEQGDIATPWSPAPSEAHPIYMGTYTDYNQADSLDPTAYQWSQIKGDSGTDGLPGKDGVGLTSTTITYAQSTSGTTAPSSGWTSSVPTVPAGQFLWTKTVWAYTDNTSETGYSVAKMGNDGATGPAGPPGSNGNPGKIVSNTEPTTKFNGLTWKYSGANDITASDGTNILAGTEYYWNGTVWALYEINAHNINGDNLSVTNGTFKDGKIESVWGGGSVKGTTTMVGNSLQIFSSDSTTNTQNYVTIDTLQGYNQAYIDYNTGRTITVQASFQGLFVSDSTGPYVRVTPTGISTSSDKSKGSFEIGAGITLELERRGDVVEATLSGFINYPLTSNTKFGVGTLPVGYRPNRIAYIMVHMTSTNNSSHIDVGTDGVCTWWGDSANDGAPRGHQMWFTDDPLLN